MSPEFHNENTTATIQTRPDTMPDRAFVVSPMNVTPEDIRAMVREVLG